MSYWNKAKIIFEEDYDPYIFYVYWGKFKDEDKKECLGFVWSNFPKQKRKDRPAPVVIPHFLVKGILNELLKYATENKLSADKVKKITNVLSSLE
jgi:hypothetical protein